MDEDAGSGDALMHADGRITEGAISLLETKAKLAGVYQIYAYNNYHLFIIWYDFVEEIISALQGVDDPSSRRPKVHEVYTTFISLNRS